MLGVLGPDAGSNTSGSWICLASVWAPNPDRGGLYLQLLEEWGWAGRGGGRRGRGSVGTASDRSPGTLLSLGSVPRLPALSLSCS